MANVLDGIRTGVKFGGYAYWGNGVLHVVKDKAIAERSADGGKVVAYPGPYDGKGYPVAFKIYHADDTVTLYKDGRSQCNEDESAVIELVKLLGL